MNKQQFLNALTARLSALSAQERKKSVDYYAEMIDDRVEEGMTQEEAVASLESVDVIAARILADHPQPQSKRKRRGWIIASVLCGVVLFCALLVGAAFLGMRIVRQIVEPRVMTHDVHTFPAVTDDPQITAETGEGSDAPFNERSMQHSAQDVHSIDVRWVSGSVNVVQGDSDEILLHEEEHGLAHVTSMHTSVKNGVLRIDFSSSMDLIANVLQGYKELTIELPRSMTAPTLLIRTNAGNISVQDVQLSDCRLKTDAGDVDFAGAFTLLDASSSAGEVTIEAVGGGTIESAETSCGSVSVSGDFLRADASTDLGDVEVTCTNTARQIEASSNMGSVRLYLPKDLGFLLEAETELGRLDIDVRDCVRRGEELLYGDGACHIELETDAGDVRVSQID